MNDNEMTEPTITPATEPTMTPTDEPMTGADMPVSLSAMPTVRTARLSEGRRLIASALLAAGLLAVGGVAIGSATSPAPTSSGTTTTPSGGGGGGTTPNHSGNCPNM